MDLDRFKTMGKNNLIPINVSQEKILWLFWLGANLSLNVNGYFHWKQTDFQKSAFLCDKYGHMKK